MIDLIASVLVRILNAFFHVMPIRFNLWIGRRIGVLVYALSGKRKWITYANLKAAFCEEKTPSEIKKLTKDVYKNLVQTFMELLSLTKMDKKYTDKYVKIRNFQNIEGAAKNPNGMILLSAHFGNWELSTVTSVNRGIPLYLLARDQKMVRLNEILNKLRESKGNIVIRKGTNIKNIFRVLHKGGSVGILADQNAGVSGELIDFFGRSASTAVGPYKFAQKSGASILPVFIHREKGAYHKVVVEPIMAIQKGEDIVPYMREYNRYLEKHIRKYPEQWLWMHKKWKLTPVKKILVLDDGKKGHLNQSLAVVKQIRKYRKEEGYSPEHLKVNVAAICFKNKGYKLFFNSLTPFLSKYFQGRLFLLKMALKKESYENISKQYADVVVSCGSGLFGVNKMMKIENNARNVTILDPGKINRAAFDLVVMPRHDAGLRGEDLCRNRIKGAWGGDNEVVTELAPNLVDVKELEATGYGIPLKSDKMGENQKGPNIGLLFGGDNSYFYFSEKLTRLVAESVKRVCEDQGGAYYVTTSRRTNLETENVLYDVFNGDKRCKDYVVGKNDKDVNTVKNILSVSDIVIVSGESISMVSEAVASGRRVLVFMPDKRRKKQTKYERFIKGLEEKGYIVCVDPEKLDEAVMKTIRGESSFDLPDDDRKIYDMMYRLF